MGSLGLDSALQPAQSCGVHDGIIANMYSINAHVSIIA